MEQALEGLLLLVNSCWYADAWYVFVIKGFLVIGVRYEQNVDSEYDSYLNSFLKVVSQSFPVEQKIPENFIISNLFW